MNEKGMMVLELNDVLHLLNHVSVEGEKNMNNQLLAIIKLKKIKESMEGEKNADHNEQGKNI